MPVIVAASHKFERESPRTTRCSLPHTATKARAAQARPASETEKSFDGAASGATIRIRCSHPVRLAGVPARLDPEGK
jgi:hypothetical protein